jgi:hypothetical protein
MAVRISTLLVNLPFLKWKVSVGANLAVAKRRTALLRNYQRVLPHAGILVLPHHGARRSFHRDLITTIPNLKVAIAAAGPNTYPSCIFCFVGSVFPLARMPFQATKI